MSFYQEEIFRIKELLRNHTGGVSVKDISDRLHINRNSIVKYLDILQVQGDVDVRLAGPSRLYFSSTRIPARSICKFCTVPLLLINHENTIIELNDAFSCRFQVTREQLLHHHIDRISCNFFPGQDVVQILKRTLNGEEFRYSIQLHLETGVLQGTVNLVPVVLENGKPGIGLVIKEQECSPSGQDHEAKSIGTNLILDDGLQFVIQYDREDTIQYVNDLYCQAIGKNKPDLIGSLFKPLIIESDQISYKQHRQRLSLSNPVDVVEHRILMDNGSIRWHRWKTTIRMDKEGKHIGFISYGIDITDLKETQTALENTCQVMQKSVDDQVYELREVNRRLDQEILNRDLLEDTLFQVQTKTTAELMFKDLLLSTEHESSTDGILVVDDLQNIISYNTRFLEIWGTSLDTISQVFCQCNISTFSILLEKLINPHEFFTKIENICENREEKVQIEIFFLDGKVVDCHSSPFFGSDGVYYGRVWYFRDISIHKYREEELNFATALLSVEHETSPDGILVTDDSRKMISYNRSIVKFLGILPDIPAPYSINQVLLPLLENLKDSTDFLSWVNEVFIHPFEKKHSELRFKDGTRVDLSITPLSGPDGVYLGSVWHFRDITEYTQIKEDLCFKNAILCADHEANPYGVVIADRSGMNIVSYNARFIEISHIPPDLLAKNSYEETFLFFTDEVVDPSQYLTRLKYIHSHPDEKCHDTIAFKDGRVLDWHTTPIHGSNDEYYGSIWYFQDITPQ